MQFDRTIAAISTAPLNAALGLVRLSGADALSIADRLFHAKSGKPLRETPGGRAVYGELRRDGLLDQVVATVFRAPHSFTGEDTVEFCCHGGVQLLSAVLSALLECGAAPAQPGEFFACIYTPCFTRSRSSARLASLKRSSVPTR